MAALLDGATGILVDGKWRDTGAAEPVRDKFTSAAVAMVRVGTASDATDAVTSAESAAACWPAGTGTARCCPRYCWPIRRPPPG